jgi:dCMP deaminase
MSNCKWDKRFLEMAKLVSTWSKDPSTKVGAVIVRDTKFVVSVGFNGFPKQMSDDEELYSNREDKYSRIVHGEINALIHSNTSVAGCTLYTYPFIPCDRCCVQMIQAGISRMVAPLPSIDSLTRWGDSFKKTKRYCSEAQVSIVELNFD